MDEYGYVRVSSANQNEDRQLLAIFATLLCLIPALMEWPWAVLAKLPFSGCLALLLDDTIGVYQITGCILVVLATLVISKNKKA